MRNPDGSARSNAYLEGKMGDDTLDAVMDDDASGEFTARFLSEGCCNYLEGPV